jgi:succinate dehydrogenase flavin-adding protein (antitoxin of CptAB toxin-antitoxin module)
MRELDEAMLAYLEHHYDNATDSERYDFEALLDWQEPELYGLVCGRDKDERYQPIIDKIATTLGSLHKAV